MKKLAFVALFSAILMMSCGTKTTETTVSADSTAVDTTEVVDSNLIDTIHISE